MHDPDKDLRQTLETDYRLFVKFPWYRGWSYDGTPHDGYVHQIRERLDACPALREGLHRFHASIYLCRDLSRTHLTDSAAGLFGNVKTSPAMCDPMRGDIFLGRMYSPNGIGESRVDHPHFVIAHELAHVLDTKLGKCIDPYGEDPPMPATKLDLFVMQAYAADEAAAHPETAASLQDVFTPRAGLLAEAHEESIRNNASEIVCDLLAHMWTGHDPDTAAALAQAYPRLHAVATVMRKAGESDEGVRTYRHLADRMATLPQMLQAFDLGPRFPEYTR